jgi:uncharacterized protein
LITFQDAEGFLAKAQHWLEEHEAENNLILGIVFRLQRFPERTMAASTRPTRNGITVNNVYTPPHQRKKGYASACVAALSQKQLDSGYKYCCLFTDLANPTSNQIYMDIGYQPVCDFGEHKFLENSPHQDIEGAG